MVKSKKSAVSKPVRVRKLDKKQPTSKLVPLLFVTGLLIFLVSGIFYYNQIYTKPSNVFWDMIGNNLSTKGITRQVIQENSETNSNEIAQFNFGAPTAVKLTRVLTSANGGADSTKLEGIGFSDSDFQRYVEVKRSAGDSAEQEFNKVLNQWVLTGSNDQSKGVEKPAILLRSLLGPVLSGNLPAVTRQAVVDDLVAKKVYTVQFDKVNKTKENGRSAYKFNTVVNLKKFTEVMNKYAKAMGIPGAEGIDPSSYQEGETIKVVLIVDLRSRQLVKIEYSDSNVKETYSGYGVSNNFAPPAQFLTSEQFRQLLGQ